MASKGYPVYAVAAIVAASLLVPFAVSGCSDRVADPARSEMRINLPADQPSVESTVEVAPPETADDSAVVGGQLIVTLRAGKDMAGVMSRHAFVIGAHVLADGSYLVFIDPLTTNEAAKSALLSDPDVASVDDNRKTLQAPVPGKDAGTPAGGGTLLPPDTSGDGITGDSGTGGLNVDVVPSK